VKPVRWVVEFQVDPRRFIKAGGKPKWTPERVHNEALRVFGSRYTGRFIPKHLQKKPRFLRIWGTKGFTRLDR
jgi:hypothetical protein